MVSFCRFRPWIFCCACLTEPFLWAWPLPSSTRTKPWSPVNSSLCQVCLLLLLPYNSIPPNLQQNNVTQNQDSNKTKGVKTKTKTDNVEAKTKSRLKQNLNQDLNCCSKASCWAPAVQHKINTALSLSSVFQNVTADEFADILYTNSTICRTNRSADKACKLKRSLRSWREEMKAAMAPVGEKKICCNNFFF